MQQTHADDYHMISEPAYLLAPTSNPIKDLENATLKWGAFAIVTGILSVISAYFDKQYGGLALWCQQQWHGTRAVRK